MVSAHKTVQNLKTTERTGYFIMAKKSFEERYEEELAKQKKKMQEMEDIQKRLEELGKKAEEERRSKFKKSESLLNDVISICAKKKIDPQIVEDGMNELLQKVKNMTAPEEEEKAEDPAEEVIPETEPEQTEPETPFSPFSNDIPTPTANDPYRPGGLY